MQFNRSTQCDFEDTVMEMNFNNFSNSSKLPLINVGINNIEAKVLIDTGSSISILSANFFHKNKTFFKYKNLARKVQISTINSSVEFQACIVFSFKIGLKSFKHAFFITEFNTHFDALLGYDFLMKHPVKINFAKNEIMIGDTTVELVHTENEKMQENNNMINNNITHADIFTEPKKDVSSSTDARSKEKFLELEANKNEDKLEIGQTLTKNDLQMMSKSKVVSPHQESEYDTSQKIYLSRKVVLCPNEYVYALVHSKINLSGNILFTPTVKNIFIEIHPYIISKNESKNCKEICSFYVYMKNLSNKSIHLNKLMNIGKIQLVDIMNDPLNLNTETKEQLRKEYINLIRPKEQVLKQRKDELLSEDFHLEHLLQFQKEKMLQLLMKNYAVFSKSLKTLGHTDAVKPHLECTSNYPIKCLPYPIPFSLQDQVKGQLRELQDADIIYRTVSNFSSPLVVVKKRKNNLNDPQTYRLAVDLRLINNILKPSAYPLPRITDTITKLSNFKFFTVLDLANAYWQVDMPEEYHDMLAFTTPFGTYANKRLIFGLKNSASIFQNLMDNIIEESQLNHISAYQDDIIIPSNSFEETMHSLEIILKILSKYNITLSPSKCEFHRNKVNFLGFQISHNRIAPLKRNIMKITSFPEPKNRKELKRFLGTCGYYRNLIPCYAKLTDPLIELTSPKVKFSWKKQHSEAFENLQKIFFSEPFLKLPDFNKDFYLNTDASTTAISGILMQEHENTLIPISYFSKHLNKAEKNYPPIKLELYAIYKSITAFKQILYNRHFFILSDSKPLKSYRKSSSPQDITTRWLCEMSEYTYTFKHIQGKDNFLADYLSRLGNIPPQDNLHSDPNIANNKALLPIVQENNGQENPPEDSTHVMPEINTENIHYSSQNNTTCPENENLNVIEVDPENEISQKTIFEEQQKDTTVKNMMKDIQKKKFPQKYKNYFIHPETKLLMFNKYNNNDTYVNLIVLPDVLKPKAIKLAHISHFGVKKTLEFLNKTFYWQGCYVDVLNFVQSCTGCINAKIPPIPRAPIQQTYTPKAPSELISLDIVGPIEGKHALTVIDHFSRHMQLYNLNSLSANAVTHCLINYISIHGRPALILSDLGVQFTSEVFAQINKLMGIKLLKTTVARPQCNAVSERINRSLKVTVKNLLKEKYDFTTALLIHQNLYNNSIHSSTGFAPALIHFGRELSTFYDTFDPSVDSPHLDKFQYFNKVLFTMKDIYAKVYRNLISAQEERNTKVNENKKLRTFQIGDTVYLKSSDKFLPSFKGPYQVIQKHTDVTYSIQRLNDEYADKLKIHIDKLLLAPPRKEHLKIPLLQEDVSAEQHPYMTLRSRQVDTARN